MKSVVTVGNFDGVHVGHRAILARCREVAQRHAAGVARPLRVVAVTFDPSPGEVLGRGEAVPRLGSVAQRVELLKAAGADMVEVLHTDTALLSQSAEVFAQGLVDRHGMAAMVEGPGFRFGKGREGSLAWLEGWQAREGSAGEMGVMGVTVEPAEVVLDDGYVAAVSSSLVRWLIGRGRVAEAARCLGRAYALRGTVVRGEGRGSTIGFGTANLDPAALQGVMVPMDGVYAGTVTVEDKGEGEGEGESGGGGGGGAYAAAISVGVKPTFGGRVLTVESHLPAWEGGAMYGRTVSVGFERFLRDAWGFPSREALVAQLGRDVGRVTAG